MYDKPPVAAPDLLSAQTFFSLLLTVVLLVAAYALSVRALPSASTTKTRVIFIWHLYDGLIHFILEGSFLYYSFTASSTSVFSSAVPTLWGNPQVAYGAKFSDAPMANLWKEYAKADRRWEEADIGVISLELLTVLLGGPCAVYIAYLVSKGKVQSWYWIAVLATAELYGGFMTFCPEWLSGNQKLETGHWVYM
jgi:hypothetical protein